ncbi:threonine-phosphate decarboxylase CobD [Rhodopseudomonas palustris]|uniref:threonine-phosphate decarboxylase n=1 Tax=Rhodopseudomonas palustris (strain BisB18) TaxID=316056 RepID=Q210A8_RHOPB
MKHGGDLTDAMARHGGAPQAWIDLSTGINPWPWPIPAIADEAWQRLPSRGDEVALIDAARAAYRVPAEIAIVAASGTQALIQWLPHLAAPGAVAIVGPTYSEHASAWRNAGREVIAIDDACALPSSARHAVIVNPNNPDGRVVDRAQLADVAAVLQARGGWLVIDEAFADVTPDISATALCAALPIVILRSFGKFYGLAGLRLGFALAAPSIADRIEAAIGPWCCSGPALRIGAAALRDRAWADATRTALTQQAIRLDAVLNKAGLNVVGGTALYRLTRHREALRIHDGLARQQIWCRRFDWADDLLRFGLPPDEAALDRLAAALG